MATPKTLKQFTPFVCQSCRRHLQPTAFRSFTTTPRRRAEEPDPLDSLLRPANPSASAPPPRSRRPSSRFSKESVGESFLQTINRSPNESWERQASENLNHQEEDPPHRLHVFATKHNTHLTLVQPAKSAAQTASSRVSSTSTRTADQKKQIDTLLSISAGNIGFRKAGRGSYDAAFQLAAFALRQMQERGMIRDLKKLEVVLRGFGAGREAVTKALLGVEGKSIRRAIVGVKDATRLKQGGPRSKKPRRLG